MNNLTPQQKKNLTRLAKVVDEGNLAILEYLNELETKIEQNTADIKAKIDSEVPSLKEIIARMKGDKGDTPTKEELISLIAPLVVQPQNGQDYVLTEQDKVEIASLVLTGIDLPTKVVEKVEIVHEVPIVTENVVEKAVTDKPEVIRDKLETLVGEERLDISAIKGVDKNETALSDSIINRAISIVDQRTSFLINKVSALQTQVNNINVSGTGGGGDTWLATTGTVDGSNKTFGVITQPLRATNDGAVLFENAGYTYNSGASTITFDLAPQSYQPMYAILSS